MFVFMIGMGYSLLGQYTILHHFTGDDGGISVSGMIRISDSLYGVTQSGGLNGKGVLFRIHPDGTGFTKLFDFDNVTGGSSQGGIININDTIFGMNTEGGSNDKGTIYRILRQGTGFMKLLDFNGTNGAHPKAELTAVNGKLIGTTSEGGSTNTGIVFSINTDGSDFRTLVDFNTATKGKYPFCSLVLYNSKLYGSTMYGGTKDMGTLFSINVDGTGYTKLLDFTGTANGANLRSAISIYNDTIWGSTPYGGTNNLGVFFRCMVDGSAFKVITNFNTTGYYSSFVRKQDLFFGVSGVGGVNDTGSICQISANGYKYPAFDFDPDSNGALPLGAACILDNYLYGTTETGGTSGWGVIYKYEYPYTPYTQSTEIRETSISETKISMSWIKSDDCSKRTVFVREGTTGIAAPVNNTTYVADTAFKKGSSIASTDWYCVYNDTGNAVTVSDLKPDTKYKIMVCDYKGTTGTEEYKTATAFGNPVLKTTLAGTIANKTIKSTDVYVYPNPASDYIIINRPSTEPISIRVFGINGDILIDKISSDNNLNIQNLIPGVYILQVGEKHFKIVKK